MSDYYSQNVGHLPLFSAARMEFREPKVLARRTDPATSKAAGVAAREFLGDHERRILEALAAGPGTKDEIASRCGLSEQQVARRRAGLLRHGLVVLTGERRRTPSGNTAEVWRKA